MKTTQKEKFALINKLQSVGFSYDEAQSLRRISNTLRNWFELECGTTNKAGSSVHIEREGNEDDDAPFMVIQFNSPQGWQTRRYKIADREAGARRRLAKIMAQHHGLSAFVQTDCRGAALYILRPDDLQDGARADQVYTRGICVY